MSLSLTQHPPASAVSHCTLALLTDTDYLDVSQIAAGLGTGPCSISRQVGRENHTLIDKTSKYTLAKSVFLLVVQSYQIPLGLLPHIQYLKLIYYNPK